MVSATFTIPLNPPEHGQHAGGCDPAFTLRSYIGGHENELVRWALGRLGIEPFQISPLTFFGPTSVGKSTLLHAVRMQWKSSLGNSVLLTNAVDYARGYAHAIETGTVRHFREKHRQTGLLVVDDLHLLATKPAAQQEFINLVDLRLEATAPIVVSLNHSPVEQAGLNEGLVSRLAGGLQVRLQLPTPATRREILDCLLEQAGLEFSTAVRETICGQRADLNSPFTTIPEIRHAILQLQDLAGQRDSCPSLDDTITLMDKEFAARKPTLSLIAKKVARHFSLKTSDLKSPSRRQWIVRARGVAFYLGRKLTDKSFKQLGRHFGGRDHTTVMHACRRTELLTQSDPAIVGAIRFLQQQIVGETGADIKTSLLEY